MDKKNIKLGIVLLVLVVLAYLYKGPFQDWREKHSQPSNFLAGIQVNEIGNIEISRGDDIVTLENLGDKWKIGGTKSFYATQSLVDYFIGELEKAINSEIELVGDNKDKKNDYNTGTNGTKVILSKDNGDVISEFIVGKSRNAESSFISRDSIDETYSVKADLSGAVSPTDWYDKKIFSTDQDKINRIRFQYPNSEFTVDKNGNNWEGILPYKFKVNTEKLTKALEIMANLTAANIPPQSFAGTGLEKHSIIIQATGENVDNVLMIGDKSPDGYYFAKKGDSDNIYQITSEQRDELVKKINDLR